MDISTWWTTGASSYLNPHVISELSSTASCRCRRTSLPSLGQATTSFQPVVRSLSVHATKRILQAFISCCLDYCNSWLYGINDGLLRRLQSVQNAAARLVTGVRWCDHIAALFTATALASSPSASHFQGPGARAPVVSWSCASVPCWWLSAAVGNRQTHPSVEFQRPAESRVWRQNKLLGCRFPNVERSFTRITVARPVFPNV